VPRRHEKVLRRRPALKRAGRTAGRDTVHMGGTVRVDAEQGGTCTPAGETAGGRRRNSWKSLDPVWLAVAAEGRG
jgi:hypothetical protein